MSLTVFGSGAENNYYQRAVTLVCFYRYYIIINIIAAIVDTIIIRYASVPKRKAKIAHRTLTIVKNLSESYVQMDNTKRIVILRVR